MSSSELRRTARRGSRPWSFRSARLSTGAVIFHSAATRCGGLRGGDGGSSARCSAGSAGAHDSGWPRRATHGPHGNALGTCGHLSETASYVACSLIRHGFSVIGLISTHGANGPALDESARHPNERHPDVVVCAPRGDVGEDPAQHAGAWLTSVMLAIRPDWVRLACVEAGLRDEISTATAASGADHLERFLSSIVNQVQEAVQRAAQ